MNTAIVTKRTYVFYKGLCETKDCTMQQWSGWSVIPGRASSCPIEARERDYTFVTRYIDAVNDCRNIGVKSCPPKERMEQQKGGLSDIE